MLHSQIQNLILKNKTNQGNAQQNLILISGDGNANDNRTSFPDIVTITLDYGYLLMEIIIQLQIFRSSTKISLQNYLDIYRSKITFT